MELPGPIERLRSTWAQRVHRSLRWLRWGAALLLILLGAHLARGGTVAFRVTAGLIMIAAGAVAFRHWQRASRVLDERRTIRQVLAEGQPDLAQRALRALTLVDRTALDQSTGSVELARAHYGKVLSQTNFDTVTAAAGRRAARYSLAALVMLGGCLLILGLGPLRIVEGFGVLLAHKGRAPVTIVWLESASVSARFPRYLHLEEYSLGLGGNVTLPAGSELVVRGRERHAGRELVLSDGAVEVPFVTDARGDKVARITLMKSAQVVVAARFGSVLVHEPRGIRVMIVPDAPPTVELKGAPRQFKLSELAELELAWSAADDHGLMQIDLVLRMGAREERRPLSRFDGTVKQRTGAHSLMPNDAFFARAFSPVMVTIEARDTNPDERAGWGVSQAFTIVPPAIGEPEAERYRALTAARAHLLGSLAEVEEPAPNAPTASRLDQVRELIAKVEGQLDRVEGHAPLPMGLRAFVTSQLEALQKAAHGQGLFQQRLAEVTLAVDAATRGLGRRDAQKVSVRLGDVAEEVAVGARAARESERRGQGVKRVDEGMIALSSSAPHLSELGDLGADLGGILRAGLTRISRVRGNEDLFHTELAALHLAARLRRPKPSFSSSSASGGGGVESGASGGSSPGENASNADQKFNHLAEQVAELAKEHAGNLKDVEQSLSEAAAQAASEPVDDEARERAEALRRAVANLPEPGRDPSTAEAAAALAREHSRAMAQGIEGRDLKGAVDSAMDALSAFEEAQRRVQGDGWLQAELERGKREVQKQLDWAKTELRKLEQKATEAAREALQRAGSSEQELARRAQQLAQQDPAGVALPEQARQRLAQAQALMDEGASRLRAGAGEEATELLRRAQQLLEQAQGEPKQAQGKQPGSPQSGGDSGLALGGEVPGDDARARAEEFRRRVIEGLGRSRAGALGPAVKRYAEGLLQ